MCKRSLRYGCRWRVDRREAWARLEEVEACGQPLIFVADRLGICPRALPSEWASEMIRAYSWWENGELGIGYANSPRWLCDALSIIGRECNRAMRVKAEEQRDRR